MLIWLIVIAALIGLWFLLAPPRGVERAADAYYARVPSPVLGRVNQQAA